MSVLLFALGCLFGAIAPFGCIVLTFRARSGRLAFFNSMFQTSHIRDEAFSVLLPLISRDELEVGDVALRAALQEAGKDDPCNCPYCRPTPVPPAARPS